MSSSQIQTAGSTSPSSLSSFDRGQLLSDLRRFCMQQGLRTEHVVALTVQRNHSTEFSSLIANLNSGRLLDVYPECGAGSTYQEGQIGDYLYAYNDELPVRPDEEQLCGGMSSVRIIDESVTGHDDRHQAHPFCCSSLSPHKDRRLDRDAVFADLLRGRGHHPDIVFGVRKQVDNGPLLSVNYFHLQNDVLTELSDTGRKFCQKLHSFKNYKCTRHGLFYAVDLYRADDRRAGMNYHHMRLNVHSQLHLPFLRNFFHAVLKPDICQPPAEGDTREGTATPATSAVSATPPITPAPPLQPGSRSE